jgi:hypothetical protein
MDTLVSANVAVDVSVVDKPRRIYPYGKGAKPLEMTHHARFGAVTLETTCDLLVGARSKNSEWDVSIAVDEAATALTRVQILMSKCLNPPDVAELDPDDGLKCATPVVEIPPISDKDFETMRSKKRDMVLGILMAKAAEAETIGLSGDEAERLRSLLSKHVNVFRVDLGDDPLVKVEPLKVWIKPDSVPVRCGMRRYPPAHVEYMREHVAASEADKMVYLNNRSTWAAAPRIVPKKEAGSLRMTIDSQPINARTVPMPWPMPNLDPAYATLVGTEVHFTLDWTKGYWQLALHPESH